MNTFKATGYIKPCRHCNNTYTASGPAGKYCPDCVKLNKFVKMVKGIYYNEILDKYEVRCKRESYGNFHQQCSSLEEAKEVYSEFNLTYRKEPNTGEFNNLCRGKGVSKQHNYNMYQQSYREGKKFFKCNRCTLIKPIVKLNIHHIDHNRDNDVLSNFEILCTICHREEHNIRDKEGKFSYEIR